MRDQAIIAHFDARAQRYDGRIKHFIGEHELRAVRSVVSEGSSVLDYGCGTGRTALDLLRRGCRVTAYDPSSAMLGIAAERARRLGHDAEFVSDPAVLTSRTWPVVTCIGVLDYYPDPTPILCRLLRFLTPGGRIVVSVPNGKSPLGWLYALRGLVDALPVTLRSARSLEQAVVRAGLTVSVVRHAFPSVRWLALTVVASLARKSTVAEDPRRSNLFRRQPVEIDAPTARAME